MRPGRLALSALMLASLAAGRPAAAATTRCVVAGPAPGYRVIRLDLASGSSFLNLEILGTRGTRPVNTGDGWHLAQGVVVLRSSDLAPVAYRLRSVGSSPPGAVVRVDGTGFAAVPQVPAPDVPFTHSAALAPAGLAAGSYLVVAWAGGGSGLGGPPDGWGAAVELDGAHSCAGAAGATVFDLDQNDFSGGTQVTVPGFAVMQGASLQRTWSEPLVVGMIDAAVQGGGQAVVAYETPTPAGSGSVEGALKPFVGPAGTYRFDADVAGLFPVVSITGVAVAL